MIQRSRTARAWALATLLAVPAILPAQEPPKVTLGGQLRPRLETRTPVRGSRDTFTSLRVRGSLEAHLEGGVRVFVQLQDVRLFGEEGNTLTDYRADALDLHQGWVELAEVPGIGGTARIGRQEMVFGEQRLVGAVDWAQQGRSFDGLRYTTPSLGGFKPDLFVMRLQEATASTQEDDATFFGAYGRLGLEEGGTVDLYALATTDSREEGTNEATLGALWTGGAGPVDFRLEGSLQTGERHGEDVSAFMVGGRAGTKVRETVTLTLWYDFLSGDEDPDDGEIGVFSTLFATNHPFYGLADYFTDIPLHTGGLGLQDAAVKVAWAPAPGTTLSADLHSFRTTQEGDLSTRSLADELDLTLTHRLTSALTVTGGYSFVDARDGMKELGRLEENAHWAYLMLNAAF